MEFPRLVYKSASEHILVENEAEHAAALKDGWHATVPDALAPKAAPIPPAVAPVTPAIAPSAPAKGKKTPAAPAGAVKPSWEA